LTSIKSLKQAEEFVNWLVENAPQYAQYVKEHKLKLIDSRLELIDELLDSGEVKVLED
jgi:hypothetical protein